MMWYGHSCYSCVQHLLSYLEYLSWAYSDHFPASHCFWLVPLIIHDFCFARLNKWMYFSMSNQQVGHQHACTHNHPLPTHMPQSRNWLLHPMMICMEDGKCMKGSWQLGLSCERQYEWGHHERHWWSSSPQDFAVLSYCVIEDGIGLFRVGDPWGDTHTEDLLAIAYFALSSLLRQAQCSISVWNTLSTQAYQ